MAIVNLEKGGNEWGGWGKEGGRESEITITNPLLLWGIYFTFMISITLHQILTKITPYIHFIKLTNVFLPVHVSHSLSLLSVPNDNKCSPSELKHSPFTCPLWAVTDDATFPFPLPLCWSRSKRGPVALRMSQNTTRLSWLPLARRYSSRGDQARDMTGWRWERREWVEEPVWMSQRVILHSFPPTVENHKSVNSTIKRRVEPWV